MRASYPPTTPGFRQRARCPGSHDRHRRVGRPGRDRSLARVRLVLRYAIMDTDLNGILQGPFDIGAGSGTFLLTSAAHVGSSLPLRGNQGTGNSATVYTINDITGAKRLRQRLQWRRRFGHSTARYPRRFRPHHLARQYIGFAWVAEDLKPAASSSRTFSIWAAPPLRAVDSLPRSHALRGGLGGRPAQGNDRYLRSMSAR